MTAEPGGGTPHYEGNVDRSGEAPMSDDSFFPDPKLNFQVVGPPITESQINSVIPDSFAAKRSL
jgi:hypothetical protein